MMWLFTGFTLGWIMRTLIRSGYREDRRPMVEAPRRQTFVRSPRRAGRRWR